MNDDSFQTAARAIARNHLTVPAVFVLEVVRPLAYLCSQALRVGAPVFDPLTGEATSRAAGLLEDPRNVDALVRALKDARSAERGG